MISFILCGMVSVFDIRAIIRFDHLLTLELNAFQTHSANTWITYIFFIKFIDKPALVTLARYLPKAQKKILRQYSAHDTHLKVFFIHLTIYTTTRKIAFRHP